MEFRSNSRQDKETPHHPRVLFDTYLQTHVYSISLNKLTGNVNVKSWSPLSLVFDWC